MNQIKDEIMSLIESRQGFTEISDQLNSEIPQMILQLRNYYQDDRAFYDIVLQIRNRWGPIFSGKLRASVSRFTTLYLNELEKLESLIQFAEAHPEVTRSKQQELDKLSDELSLLMDPFANVIKGLKRTSIKPKIGIVKKRRP
jgi:hypothetical protein